MQVTRENDRSKFVVNNALSPIGYDENNELDFSLRLLTTVIFNVLSIIGATCTGCIAGIIGFYIIGHTDTVCYPELYAYDNSKRDCKSKLQT